MQCNITIRKKDKGYQCIVSYKDGNRWRQKSKQGFETQKAAKIHAQTIIDKLKKTITATDDSLRNITLIDFFNIYIRENAPKTFNTLRTYRNTFDFFKPLHNEKLTNITPYHVKRVLNDISYSTASKNLALGIIQRLFSYAVLPYKILPINELKVIPRYTNSKPEKIKALTDDEIEMFLSGVKSINYTYYILYCIAVYAGMRYGEIIGLTWENVDLDNNTINVVQQFGAIDYNVYSMKPLKSKNSYRQLPIPPVLKNVLLEYKETCTTDRLFNMRISSSGVASEMMKRFLPDNSIHDLRHTYATKLLSNGVDIKTVSALLGDSLQTVLKTYVHFSDDMRIKAADKVADIFG
jgi:integrase